MQVPQHHRWVVGACALAVVLLRLLGLGQSPGADEAGFMLVAQSWDPAPDSVYGHYFVDRPPFLLLVLKVLGAVDGTTAVRLAGALGCALTVLLAAGAARTVAGGRAPRWVALCTAAILANPLIDPVDVKGEVLGLPLLMGSCWLSLLALRRETGRRAWLLALLAGVTGSLAAGLKQSMVGALVFAGVLLVASLATGRLGWSSFARLATAGLVGAVLHPLATVGWALWAGVELDTLSYAVLGFRADANAVLEARPSSANEWRALVLALVAVFSGVAVVLACFVAVLPRLWRSNPALTAAIAGMVAWELWVITASGSFWRDYLFALVPATALAVAGACGALERGALLVPVPILAITASSLVCATIWVAADPGWMGSAKEDDTGQAIAEVAEPGDTLTVFGGRADVQATSGLPSPYRHLWSLPMRTLDPDLEELLALVEGPDAPTWLVEVAHFEVWNRPAGARLRDAVEARYDVTVPGCGMAQRIWHLSTADRAEPRPRC
ncbi:hypothetical protein [Nocardioides solisilvae]|uniref:hypothetical protein n=1 Tax=Nocardioides solisilvae TaxID=1542435 RepID=UPI0013A5BD22|nr:hypothetical protein [Nocardioides solisilvae]